MKTEIITENIPRAAELIRAGGLVAVPTETVYGLAGNGLDETAVQRIYDVKDRPEVKPLSLMVPDAGAFDAVCRDVPPAARALAEKFWPGPLTIVLPAKDTVPAIVRAGALSYTEFCFRLTNQNRPAPHLRHRILHRSPAHLPRGAPA